MLRDDRVGSKGHRTFLRGLGLLCLALLSAVTAGCGKRQAEAVISRRDIIEYLPLKGKVVAQASAHADVVSPYTAPIAEVYVTVGQNVRRGDALILLSEPQNQAYYEQARVALLQAQSALSQAKKQYGQQLQAAQKRLALSRSAEKSARAATASPPVGAGPSTTPPSSPPADISSLVSNRQADEQAVIDAQARMSEGLVGYQQAVASAQEQFASAQAGSKAAQIKSPITGTVLAVNATAGKTPNSRDKKPLVTVVDLEALRIAAGLSEDQLKLLRLKDPAVVTIKEVPNTRFTASLDEIYSEKAGFLEGQKYVALVDFDNPKGQAKPGMDATAAIKTGEVDNVLAVPNNAIIEVNSHQAVKVRVGNEWRQRVIETGLSDGKYTEVKSGLTEGDVVMVNP